eukprot:CAMPEP_0184691930 /NCGR_PEP_ID=MMETSP0313-20130426/617_1 /TAXON_ID=2792 /ORGANISM="Porphyridium aerugineum, Strain SAG 1380-2" /LENGTH=87 /DNA_ID=CAMNT_0027149713 /DNA_START=175 /DNA_END=438 /DNA_ORIENTATION=+
MKWGLVFAGLADINRPIDKVSVPINLAMTLTGVIWARWSFVITPVNYNLAFVNVFVGGTGLYQLYRVFLSPEAKAMRANRQKAISTK